MRSLKGRESVTPPGGTWGKSLKRGCSSAPSAIQQDPPRTRFSPPPSVSTLPTSPQVSVTRRRGSLEPALRSLALSGATTEGGAQVFGRPGKVVSAFTACLHRVEGVGPRLGPLGAATRSRARRQRPARSSKHTRATAGCTWCALGAAMPASSSLLRAATPALCPPARPFAPRSLTVTPAGRARRLAKPSGVPPRLPLGPPRPALSALRPSQSPSPAARYFHTSQCPGPGA